MKASTIFFVLISIGVIYQVYRSVVSMPDFVINETVAFEQKIERQEKHLAARENAFKQLESSKDWEFLGRYSQAEDWPNHFSVSTQALNKTKAFFKQNITPLYDRNHKEDSEKLLSELHQGKKLLAVSVEESNYPRQRADFLLESREKKDTYFKVAKLRLADTQAITERFAQTAEASMGQHPHKAVDIDKKISATKASLASILTDFNTMQDEYNASSTNYAIYADAYSNITEKFSVAEQDIDTKTTQLQELDQTYIKVLSDQKIDYFVTVGRANWCESDTCGNGSEMLYPPAKVDADTFEYFDSLTVNTIAKYNPGFSRSRKLSLSIPKSRWNGLRIKSKYRWPRNRNYAEYWIEKTFTKAYHKYTTIVDGEASVGDWVLVSGTRFEKHFNNLGMAIETKPIGSYASEAITQAEPVGMATIAEPTMVNGEATGSNQYGEWRQSNGYSVWHYYGMYRLLGDFITPGRYRYNDWRGYSSHNAGSPYYGRNNEFGTYGNSTYSSARYQNSDFYKRNPNVASDAKTGRRSTTTSSIRGAGSASRGRGPSGGGK